MSLSAWAVLEVLSSVSATLHASKKDIELKFEALCLIFKIQRTSLKPLFFFCVCVYLF